MSSRNPLTLTTEQIFTMNRPEFSLQDNQLCVKIDGKYFRRIPAYMLDEYIDDKKNTVIPPMYVLAIPDTSSATTTAMEAGRSTSTNMQEGKKRRKEPNTPNWRHLAAQLVHYGIQVPKQIQSRVSLINKLREAFTTAKQEGRMLEVPQIILDYEQELRKNLEWHLAQQQQSQQQSTGSGSKTAESGPSGSSSKGVVEDKENSDVSASNSKASSPKGSNGQRGHPTTTTTALMKCEKTDVDEVVDKVSKLPPVQSRNLPSRRVKQLPTGHSEPVVAAPVTVEKRASTKPALKWRGQYEVPITNTSGKIWMVKSWMALASSSTSSHIWGSFDFGHTHGIIRSNGPPPTKPDEKMLFYWRGREAKGQEYYGARNSGIFTFRGDGKLEVRMISDAEEKYGFIAKLTEDDNLTRRQGLEPHWDVGPETVNDREVVRNWKRQWRSYHLGNLHTGGVDFIDPLFQSIFHLDEKLVFPSDKGLESAFESDTSDGHHTIGE